jgi:hypothetical protein
MFYKTRIKLWLTLLFVCIATYSYADPDLTDDEIANILIQESISNYSGRCPCPYNLMKDGRRCGGNSAYSKPRGESPLCYREDVTEELIGEWREGQSKN